MDTRIIILGGLQHIGDALLQLRLNDSSLDTTSSRGITKPFMSPAMAILQSGDVKREFSSSQLAKLCTVFLDESKAQLFCLMTDHYIRVEWLKAELGEKIE